MTAAEIAVCDQHRGALFEFLVFRTYYGRALPRDKYASFYSMASAYFKEKPWKGSLQLTAQGPVCAERADPPG